MGQSPTEVWPPPPHVAPGLVQYYFPSLDELFIAVLREATDRLIADLTDATDSEQPLRAVWAYASNPTGTALLMQFMALANHLPQLGSVIGEGGERVRQALSQALTKKWPEYGLDDTGLTPGAILFLLSAIPRMMHLEEVTRHCHGTHGYLDSGRALPGPCRATIVLTARPLHV